MHINEKNRTPKLDEVDEGPSKSELKRQMTERQKLAEVLAALSSDALKTIPLDEAIKVAIAETNKIKSFEAIRRHKQYLGKLMRFLDEEELEAIQKRLDAIQGISKAETAKLHFLESYRDRLIANDEAFTKMIEQYLLCPFWHIEYYPFVVPSFSHPSPLPFSNTMALDLLFMRLR